MRQQRRVANNEIVFEVCCRFLEGQRVNQILKWLQEHLDNPTRETVYYLVREGVKRGFIHAKAPEEVGLGQVLRTRYPSIDTMVLDVKGKGAVHHIAARGAELIVELIHIVGEEKGGSARIGMGGGMTTQTFAQHLAIRLRAEERLPRLYIHALTSGFDVERPLGAPVAFFSLFHDLQRVTPDVVIDFVGLFAPAVIPYGQYEIIKKNRGVREALTLSREIDIVITSLGAADDQHSMYNAILGFEENDKKKEYLERKGWMGDILWRPFSNEGPIKEDKGLLTVTLLEPEDLKNQQHTKQACSMSCGTMCGVRKD